MICQECIDTLERWQKANEVLARESAALTTIAISGDQQAFDDKAVEVEQARLCAENARVAISAHRLHCHATVPADLHR